MTHLNHLTLNLFCMSNPLFTDGDDLILFDKETDLVLYGHEVFRQVLRQNRLLEAEALHVRVSAEAYIALLMNCFSDVPEVRKYLAETGRTETINPDGEGKLLEAASNAIWIEKRHLNILLNVTGTGEGEEWKQ